MKKNKKLLLILIVCLVSINTMRAMANVEIDNLKKEKDEINQQIEGKKTEIDDLKVQVDNVQEEIKKLDNQIDVASSNLSVVEGLVQELQVAIDENTVKLENARTNLEDNQETLEKRLRVLYMSGEMSNLEILLGANDIEELLTRFEMLEMIAKQDKDLITFTNKQIVTIKETEAELVVQHEEQKQRQAELQVQKQKLVDANNVKISFMQQLQQDKVAAEKEYDKFVENTKNIDAKIVELEKKLEEQRKAAAAKRQMSGAVISGSGELSWPVPGYSHISSYYGYRIHPIFNTKKYHAGIDIPAPTGTPIRAASDGIVISSGWQGGYGKCVMISHGNGIVTLYGHNSTLNVSVGQYVGKGETIALCGSTGYSTGAHCHFEVRVNGATVDPLGYL
ncbi:MAG: peptidoglycan DD-metalloendopeptidase family protein [Tissierellia bacterium]|nr:peptidoglycan DD-metalloendopeptidase family protein [Tissierellia bacterium]